MTHYEVASREYKESKFPMAFSHQRHGSLKTPHRHSVRCPQLALAPTQVSERDPLEQRASFQAHGSAEGSSVWTLRRRPIRPHHNWLQVASWSGSYRVFWTLTIQHHGLCPPTLPLMSEVLFISLSMLCTPSAKPHSVLPFWFMRLLSHHTYHPLCLLLSGDFPWELFSPLQTPGRGPLFLRRLAFPLKTVLHCVGIISSLVSTARPWPWVLA